MSPPTFAKTLNLIAYLAKPTESEGFKQIIAFLNGSSVSYALTASPTIRTSCIKQFWTTKKAKTINNEVRIQALIDEKRLGNMSDYNDIYDNPSLTKKVFANMKRVGTGFSRVVTPFLDTMLPSPSNDPLPGVDIKSTYKERIEKLEGRVDRRVKKLEKKKKTRTSGLKRLWKVRTARRIESSTKSSLGDLEDASKQRRMIDNLDQDVEITLVDETQRRMNEEDMFRVNDLDCDEVVVDVEQSVKVVEKETLIEIKAAKPKAITTAATTVTAASTRPKVEEIVMQEPSKTPSTKPIDSSQQPSQAKDKGKEKWLSLKGL
nr:hypothetical protein [Tanacetum cinerariifolium]